MGQRAHLCSDFLKTSISYTVKSSYTYKFLQLDLSFGSYRFEECLDISPQLYPMNCLRAVSTEIGHFKEQLCEIRSKLLEVILIM